MKASAILLAVSAIALSAARPSFAGLPDCRAWNPDNNTPQGCQPLIQLHEMQKSGSQYAPTDNLFELFVVEGAHDELLGVEYIKNRARGFGSNDKDKDGALRLVYKAPAMADLETAAGYVMNDNHDSVRLGLNSGFDADRGGDAFINYLVDGATGKRAAAFYHLGRDAGGKWALYDKAAYDSQGESAREISALDMFTNYGFLNMVIGVRNISAEYR